MNHCVFNFEFMAEVSYRDGKIVDWNMVYNPDDFTNRCSLPSVNPNPNLATLADDTAGRKWLDSFLRHIEVCMDAPDDEIEQHWNTGMGHYWADNGNFHWMDVPALRV
eukprot:m.468756 g.468756  ORF g.468756 m.468756 type:complete len:108 (-) comp27814_c0_seq1:325-648(-)